MNLLRNIFVLCAAALLCGCEGLQQAGQPTRGPGYNVLENAQQVNSEEIRVGEVISIEFLETSQKIDQMVQEDGKLTLILGQTVQAAGKKSSDLQRDIVDLYVPKYFKRMTVNIKRDNRYYWVDGEVRNPSQRPYTGDMTVLRAIAGAGGFNEYANKKAIQITRANGKKEMVNGVKALKDPKLDLPIYPGDRINVREDWK